MEIQDLRSKETVEFIKALEKLSEKIKTAFSQRAPILNGEKYLTTKQLSGLLHMSERLLQDYRDARKIPYIQISGKVLYKESDVLKLLEDNYHPLRGGL